MIQLTSSDSCDVKVKSIESQNGSKKRINITPWYPVHDCLLILINIHCHLFLISFINSNWNSHCMIDTFILS
ncbi:hypothetical protein DFA_01551 [Cavenderia fasciculata]|uniref:Uncharacterized protein n=1 Tax=Cavenderia fasciculata TaxID=261658 RepID=F4PTE3_CACFS|nr:uncharacterized protein DFA_01551 [Cavenderia fasciculata]EGG21665.1 hypothetical protein DFA_01551 [Cavenderia fasciculata]|eukprot:XP_004359515.1 hypothetical protein DFA_01551 [Cavenderia fasciculata]